MKEEDKMTSILECLNKTAPPVLIFAERTRDVDLVHEYLLLKGIDAVAIHGGKDQGERIKSIDRFKSGDADILCATDVAGKGLDFEGAPPPPPPPHPNPLDVRVLTTLPKLF